MWKDRCGGLGLEAARALSDIELMAAADVIVFLPGG